MKPPPPPPPPFFWWSGGGGVGGHRLVTHIRFNSYWLSLDRKLRSLLKGRQKAQWAFGSAGWSLFTLTTALFWNISGQFLVPPFFFFFKAPQKIQASVDKLATIHASDHPTNPVPNNKKSLLPLWQSGGWERCPCPAVRCTCGHRWPQE